MNSAATLTNTLIDVIRFDDDLIARELGVSKEKYTYPQQKKIDVERLYNGIMSLVTVHEQTTATSQGAQSFLSGLPLLNAIHHKVTSALKPVKKANKEPLYSVETGQIQDCFNKKPDLMMPLAMTGKSDTVSRLRLFWSLYALCVRKYGLRKKYHFLTDILNGTEIEDSPQQTMQRLIDFDIEHAMIDWLEPDLPKGLFDEKTHRALKAEMDKLQDAIERRFQTQGAEDIDELNNFTENYWLRDDLPITRFFLYPLTEEKRKEESEATKKTRRKYVDRMFCHVNATFWKYMIGRRDIEYIIADWIPGRIELLMNEGSETCRAFKYLFGISGNLWGKNGLSSASERQLPNNCARELMSARKKAGNKSGDTASSVRRIGGSVIETININVPPAQFNHNTGELLFSEDVPPDFDGVSLQIYLGSRRVAKALLGFNGNRRHMGPDEYMGSEIDDPRAVDLWTNGWAWRKSEEFYSVMVAGTQGEKMGNLRGIGRFQAPVVNAPRPREARQPREKAPDPVYPKSQTPSSSSVSITSSTPAVTAESQKLFSPDIYAKHFLLLTELFIRSVNEDAAVEDLKTAVALCLDEFTEEQLLDYFSANYTYENGLLRFEVSPEMLADAVGYEQSELLVSIHDIAEINTRWEMQFDERGKIIKKDGVRLPSDKILNVARSLRKRIISRAISQKTMEDMDTIGMSPNGSVDGRIVQITHYWGLAGAVSKFQDAQGKDGDYRLFESGQVRDPLVVTLQRRSPSEPKKYLWSLALTFNAKEPVSIRFETRQGLVIDSAAIASGLLHWVENTQHKREAIAKKKVESGEGEFGQLIRESRLLITVPERRSLLRRFKNEMKQSGGRIVCRHKDETLEVVDGVNAENAKEIIEDLQKKHGEKSVAFVLRRDTYGFESQKNTEIAPAPASEGEWREKSVTDLIATQRVYDPKLQDAILSSMSEPRNQEIIFERCMATLYGNCAEAKGRAKFRPNQRIHFLFEEFCEARLLSSLSKIQFMTDFRAVLGDFIKLLQGEKIPTMYQRMIIDLCPPAEKFNPADYFDVPDAAAQSDKSPQPAPELSGV